MRGGIDDNDLRVRSYMPRISLRGTIVAGVMSRQVTGENDLFFPSNSVRLLMGSSKEDKKISADDIVKFSHLNKCITCYQRLRDGS
jgi:hypothetical protein